jgi:hypothetical protein
VLHLCFLSAAPLPLHLYSIHASNPLPSTFLSHIPHTGKVNIGLQACTGSNEMKDEIVCKMPHRSQTGNYGMHTRAKWEMTGCTRTANTNDK